MLRVTMKLRILLGVFVFTLCGCAPTLYWSEVRPGADLQERGPHRIMRATLSGKTPKPEVVLDTGNIKPIGIAVDASNDKLYWASPELRRIRLFDLVKHTSADFPKAGAFVDYPVQVVLDHGTHRLFWTAQGIDAPNTGKIQYAYTQGTDTAIHDLATGLQGPTGIALDVRPTHRRVYWITGSGKLQSINMDGTEKLPTDHHLPPVTSEPFSLALIPESGMFYWPNNGWTVISWCRLENGRVVQHGILKDDLPASQPVAVYADERSGKLYWGYRRFPKAAVTRSDFNGKQTEGVVNGNAAGIDLVYPSLLH